MKRPAALAAAVALLVAGAQAQVLSGAVGAGGEENALSAAARRSEGAPSASSGLPGAARLTAEGLIALSLRDSGGRLQIFTIRPDGTARKQLTFEGRVAPRHGPETARESLS